MLKISIKNRNKQWKPKNGEKYYSILIDGGIDILEDYWSDEEYHKEGFKIGNCFRNRKDAEEAILRILKALLEYKNENKDEKEPYMSVEMLKS